MTRPSIDGIRRVLCAAFMCVALPAFGQDVTVPFTITAEPEDEAEELILESATGPKRLAGAADFVESSVDVPVPFRSPPFEDAVIRIEWQDGSESSFPIFLSLGDPGGTFVLLVQQPRSAEVPTKNEVSRDCLQREADTISRAFEMFFTCRAHAFRLEEEGLGVGNPEPAFRYALAGWLKANYRLYVNPFCNPAVNPGCAQTPRVSPYGADPDLLSRLRQIVALDRWDAWLPFRVADAQSFINYVDQRPLQLVNLIPELAATDRIEDARAINDAARAAIESIEDGNNEFGITEDLLIRNLSIF